MGITFVALTSFHECRVIKLLLDERRPPNDIVLPQNADVNQALLTSKFITRRSQTIIYANARKGGADWEIMQKLNEMIKRQVIVTRHRVKDFRDDRWGIY